MISEHDGGSGGSGSGAAKKDSDGEGQRADNGGVESVAGGREGAGRSRRRRVAADGVCRGEQHHRVCGGAGRGREAHDEGGAECGELARRSMLWRSSGVASTCRS